MTTKFMIVRRVKIHCRFLPFASLSSFALCSKIQFKICYRKELEQSSAWTRFASNLILCGINSTNLSFNILSFCISFFQETEVNPCLPRFHFILVVVPFLVRWKLKSQLHTLQTLVSLSWRNTRLFSVPISRSFWEESKIQQLQSSDFVETLL